MAFSLSRLCWGIYGCRTKNWASIPITDGADRYTTIQRDGQEERAYLQELMKRQRSVIGRATTCWRASLADNPNEQVVIKDSWEYEEQPEEGLLLKEATEAGVKNVAQYYSHETVCVGGKKDEVLDNVRKGHSVTEGRIPLQERRSTLSEPTSSSRGEARRKRDHRAVVSHPCRPLNVRVRTCP